MKNLMRQTSALTVFMTKNFLFSLHGFVPLILTVGLFWITFYYAGDVNYFSSLGSIDLVIVNTATTLLLCERSNKAATYPFLARLSNRGGLLAAITASSLAVTLVMAVLFTGLALGLHKVELAFTDYLIIVPRWGALFIFAAVSGLHLSKLVSRGNSYLFAYGILAFLTLMTERDQRGLLLTDKPDWLISAVAALTYPLTTIITSPVNFQGSGSYFISPTLTLLYALILFLLANRLFRYKDLLWTE